MRKIKFLSFNFFKRKTLLLTTVYLKEGKVLNIETVTFSSKEEAKDKMQKNIRIFITHGENVFYKTKVVMDTYARAEVQNESIYCNISKIKI
jgi:hypothetical protein